jgi:hypothetical protein
MICIVLMKIMNYRSSIVNETIARGTAFRHRSRCVCGLKRRRWISQGR